MEKISAKTIRGKCPECSNYMTFKVNADGSETGVCKVCKAIVHSKQKNVNEKIIRITTRTKQAI